MSGMLRTTSRLRQQLTNNNNNNRIRYFCSTISSNTSSASSHLNDLPPPPPAAETISTINKKKSSWRFLKYGIFGTLLGTSATLGYAHYAYTVDEFDEKTKAFRQAAVDYTKSHTVKDDASSLEKFVASLSSSAMTGPAKVVERYLEIRRSIEEQIVGIQEPSSDKLLPDLPDHEKRILTIVLDLNETLVYTDWKRERGWRTFKRPGVDAFLEKLSEFYEIVIYSDQLDMYVEPIVIRLDQKQLIRHRLSRSDTKYKDGKHYRDLSKLNRDLSKVIYVSGHAVETAFQSENCAPIKPWKLEEGDTALIDLLPFLEFIARQTYTRHDPTDIRKVLAAYKDCDIATEFNKRHRVMLENQKPATKRLFSR